MSASEASSVPFRDVGPISAVPPGDAIAFEASGRRFVVCNAGGQLYAVADRCTHAAWPLAGSDLRDCDLVCSLHGARFDLRTGVATAPPATKPLQTYLTRTEHGRILVRLPPPVT